MQKFSETLIHCDIIRNMKLYNSRTRKIEEFTSLTPGIVKMYSCGPTVYDHAHIGNIRAFIFADILRKTLESIGYKVTQIMNITDFGHLKGDGDDGEDKMSLGLKRENFPRTMEGMKMLADKYTNLFFEDIKKVNIKPADFYPRAIEHINEYIEIIKGVEAKGFTYKIADGIYFDTGKDPNYGYMSLLDKHDHGQSRIGEKSDKKNQADFCLWKFTDENLSILGFESPWGLGFPGWHIECSGMALKYLGEQMDIHTGGVDHINVHHTNEIAQSENFTGKTYSTFFCHNEFLDLDNEKMAKSTGNYFTIESIVEKNISPIAFRYLTLQNHYRQKLNFTIESLQASETALNKLKRQVEKMDKNETEEINEKYFNKFKSQLENDLNTAQALATLWTLLKDKEVTDNQKYWTIKKFDEVFSLGL
jgi:cysteinyl-tRNA synthetase